MVAGIDISFDLEDNDVGSWQLHLYMIIEGEHTHGLEEAVKATLPPEPSAQVPYRFTQVTGAVRPVTYLRFSGAVLGTPSTSGDLEPETCLSSVLSCGSWLSFWANTLSVRA